MFHTQRSYQKRIPTEPSPILSLAELSQTLIERDELRCGLEAVAMAILHNVKFGSLRAILRLFIAFTAQPRNDGK